MKLMDSWIFGGWFKYFVHYLMDVKSRNFFYYHLLIFKKICVSVIMLEYKERCVCEYTCLVSLDVCKGGEAYYCFEFGHFVNPVFNLNCVVA